MPDEPKTERQIARVMQLSVAVSLGFMAAFFWSLKQVNSHVRFEVSPGTGIAFLATAAISWQAWPMVAREQRRARRHFLLFAVGVVVLTAGAFIYGVKDVSREKMRDVAIGAALAALALSVLGLAIWRVGKFLEKDSRQIDPDRPDSSF